MSLQTKKNGLNDLDCPIDHMYMGFDWYMNTRECLQLTCMLARDGRILDRTTDSHAACSRDLCGGTGTLCCGRNLKKTTFMRQIPKLCFNLRMRVAVKLWMINTFKLLKPLISQYVVITNMMLYTRLASQS